ncbi:uncharacterized protein LOC122379117 [Amphibalanus amphitrite]|uniref:uncharacterized protein LOC122379117 n=1 Tax=Amphibalanus amphitrite TaxID=1232801 RepID=UPI001C912C5F|nr:uncharacterized protein LOC122379117 [Amphibalanus amphitrite]
MGRRTLPSTLVIGFVLLVAVLVTASPSQIHHHADGSTDGRLKRSPGQLQLLNGPLGAEYSGAEGDVGGTLSDGWRSDALHLPSTDRQLLSTGRQLPGLSGLGLLYNVAVGIIGTVIVGIGATAAAVYVAQSQEEESTTAAPTTTTVPTKPSFPSPQPTTPPSTASTSSTEQPPIPLPIPG